MPREKLKNEGVNTLSDTEILAILLQSGTKGISVQMLAQMLLEKYDGLANVFQQSFEELTKNKGIGEVKALKIIALGSLIHRVNKEEIYTQKVIQNPEDVFKLCGKYRNAKQEYLLVLSLDVKNQVISLEEVYIGTINEIRLHPREIFGLAMKKLAAKIIIIHNHPSGDPTASKADIKTTEELIKISRIVDVELTDHIIISKNHYYSIREKYAIIFLR